MPDSVFPGFLTCKHFCGETELNGGKEVVFYTIRKLKPIFPYYFVITVLAWTTRNILAALNGGGIKEFRINPTIKKWIVHTYSGYCNMMSHNNHHCNKPI